MDPAMPQNEFRGHLQHSRIVRNQTPEFDINYFKGRLNLKENFNLVRVEVPKTESLEDLVSLGVDLPRRDKYPYNQSCNSDK